MVGLIVLGRIYLVEPFKIPSGSMEPTLFGHEDFGDRILTNKLAYMPALEALFAAAAFLLLLLQGLAWGVDFKAGQEQRSRTGMFLTAALIALRVVKSFRFPLVHAGASITPGLALTAVLGVLTLVWYAQHFREALSHRGALVWTVCR